MPNVGIMMMVWDISILITYMKDILIKVKHEGILEIEIFC